LVSKQVEFLQDIVGYIVREFL